MKNILIKSKDLPKGQDKLKKIYNLTPQQAKYVRHYIVDHKLEGSEQDLCIDVLEDDEVAMNPTAELAEAVPTTVVNPKTKPSFTSGYEGFSFCGRTKDGEYKFSVNDKHVVHWFGGLLFAGGSIVVIRKFVDLVRYIKGEKPGDMNDTGLADDVNNQEQTGDEQ